MSERGQGAAAPYASSATCANRRCGKAVRGSGGAFCSTYCGERWDQEQRGGIAEEVQPATGFPLRSSAPTGAPCGMELRRCQGLGCMNVAKGCTGYCSSSCKEGPQLERQQLRCKPTGGGFKLSTSFSRVSGEATSTISTSAGSSASGDASSSSSREENTCLRLGCGKPTWNGQPHEYCGRACKAPICMRAGCCKPTRNGLPFDYCGSECRPRGFISMAPAGAVHVCMSATCGKPTWKGQLCEPCTTAYTQYVPAPRQNAICHEPYSM